MQPTKQSIHDIFTAERRYLVPLYQRSYVWSQEKQWEPLWADIEYQALSALHNLKLGSKPATHFLGALVISARKTVGLAHPISEIIDGQQRLTTFQIFLTAFRDLLAKTEHQEALDAICRITSNSNRRGDPQGRYKVWPTNSDREAYVKVMTAGDKKQVAGVFGGETSIAKSGPRIAEAYLFFSGVIQAFMEGSEMPEVMASFSAQDRIDALRIALRDQLMCVVIELEENDDPQIIFETLNARGQPLLPSDLIRNYLFLQASNEGKDSDHLYETYWKPFDDIQKSGNETNQIRFWHDEERQGRLTRPRIDLFIFHFITMNAVREVNIGQLYTEFRRWQSQHDGGVEDILQEISISRGHFRRILEPDEKDRLLLFAKRLRSLDTSTVHPVLLYLMGLTKEALNITDRDQIIEDLESYMVRRFICNLTPKNYNRFFVNLLAVMKSAVENGEPLADVVRSELTRPEGPAGRWPDDTEFERGWLETPIYVRSRPDRAVMVLQAIEKSIRSNKSESVSLPSDLTVEHILPQSATIETHPYGSETHLKEHETPEIGRQRIINTIGNLTLLTGPLNASVGTDAIRQKLESLSEHSLLRLNILLQKYKGDVWSEDQIIDRAQELFEYAREIWSHPNS